jgi:hypothetical protein
VRLSLRAAAGDEVVRLGWRRKVLSDAEVFDELTGAGAAIADYFFIGESFYCINSRGELGGLAADDELSNAMAAYLHRQGAPEYASEDEARRLHAERGASSWQRRHKSGGCN